jgi:hypothetical protein
MDDKRQDSGAIPTVGALDTCADVGPHCLIRGFRASLSTCRTCLAGVEYLRPADVGADPQFLFSGEHQFQGDHRYSPLFMGR